MEPRVDVEWMKAANKYREARANLDYWKQQEADAREALLHIANGEDASGFGVSVKKQERKGSIDYKLMVTELLPQEDAEPYRKDGVEFFKVDVSKE